MRHFRASLSWYSRNAAITVSVVITETQSWCTHACMSCHWPSCIPIIPRAGPIAVSMVSPCLIKVWSGPGGLGITAFSYIATFVPFASNLFNLTVPFLDGRNRTFLPYYPAKSQSRQFYLISLFLIFISKVQKFSETCVMKNEGRQLVLSDMKFSRECHTETNALQGWGDTAAGSMLKRSGLAVLWM